MPTSVWIRMYAFTTFDVLLLGAAAMLDLGQEGAQRGAVCPVRGRGDLSDDHRVARMAREVTET